MPKKKNKAIDTDERFCQHYVQYNNATQACLYAKGDKRVDANGITYETAKTEGTRMLAKPHIKLRIQQIREEMQVQYNQTIENTIMDLINAAEDAKKIGQFQAYAKLRDMVIKIMGFYAPQKKAVDITSNGAPIEINLNLGNETKDTD